MAESPRGVLNAVAKRVVTAVVFIPLFLLLLYRGPSGLFHALLLLVSVLGQWEFTRMFVRAGEHAFPRLGLIVGLGVTASFLVASVAPMALAVAVLVVLSAPVVGGRPPAWGAAALTLLGVLYVNWLLGHGIWLRELPQGADWIVFLVAVTWSGETAAYVVGSLIGRHKLAPVISPRKTVEGAVAQVLGSVLAAVLVARVVFPELPLLLTIVGGALLGITGQFGDLAESVMKRSVHAKDTGALIPGHGGMLDRLDSLLFNTPALFYYARYVV